MTTIEEIFSELPYELDREVFGAPSFGGRDGREYKKILDQFQWMVYNEPTLDSVHVYDKKNKRFSKSETAKCFDIIALKEPLLINLGYTHISYDDTVNDTVDNAIVEDRVHSFYIVGTVYEILLIIYKEYISVSGDSESDCLFFEGINSYGYITFGS
jgi:hypothetical protein